MIYFLHQQQTFDHPIFLPRVLTIQETVNRESLLNHEITEATEAKHFLKSLPDSQFAKSH